MMPLRTAALNGSRHFKILEYACFAGRIPRKEASRQLATLESGLQHRAGLRSWTQTIAGMKISSKRATSSWPKRSIV